MTIARRESRNQSVAILTTSSSPDIAIDHAASGELAVPHAETVVTLTYYVKMPDGSYYAAQDATGTAITQTVAADKAYPIPAALFGAAVLQIRGNVAGNLVITLKS